MFGSGHIPLLGDFVADQCRWILRYQESTSPPEDIVPAVDELKQRAWESFRAVRAVASADANRQDAAWSRAVKSVITFDDPPPDALSVQPYYISASYLLPGKTGCIVLYPDVATSYMERTRRLSAGEANMYFERAAAKTAWDVLRGSALRASTDLRSDRRSAFVKATAAGNVCCTLDTQHVFPDDVIHLEDAADDTLHATVANTSCAHGMATELHPIDHYPPLFDECYFARGEAGAGHGTKVDVKFEMLDGKSVLFSIGVHNVRVSGVNLDDPPSQGTVCDLEDVDTLKLRDLCARAHGKEWLKLHAVYVPNRAFALDVVQYDLSGQTDVHVLPLAVRFEVPERAPSDGLVDWLVVRHRGALFVMSCKLPSMARMCDDVLVSAWSGDLKQPFVAQTTAHWSVDDTTVPSTLTDEEDTNDLTLSRGSPPLPTTLSVVDNHIRRVVGTVDPPEELSKAQVVRAPPDGDMKHAAREYVVARQDTAEVIASVNDALRMFKEVRVGCCLACLACGRLVRHGDRDVIRLPASPRDVSSTDLQIDALRRRGCVCTHETVRHQTLLRDSGQRVSVTRPPLPDPELQMARVCAGRRPLGHPDALSVGAHRAFNMANAYVLPWVYLVGLTRRGGYGDANATRPSGELFGLLASVVTDTRSVLLVDKVGGVHCYVDENVQVPLCEELPCSEAAIRALSSAIVWQEVEQFGCDRFSVYRSETRADDTNDLRLMQGGRVYGVAPPSPSVCVRLPMVSGHDDDFFAVRPGPDSEDAPDGAPADGCAPLTAASLLHLPLAYEVRECVADSGMVSAFLARHAVYASSLPVCVAHREPWEETVGALTPSSSCYLAYGARAPAYMCWLIIRGRLRRQHRDGATAPVLNLWQSLLRVVLSGSADRLLWTVAELANENGASRPYPLERATALLEQLAAARLDLDDDTFARARAIVAADGGSVRRLLGMQLRAFAALAECASFVGIVHALAAVVHGMTPAMLQALKRRDHLRARELPRGVSVTAFLQEFHMPSNTLSLERKVFDMCRGRSIAYATALRRFLRSQMVPCADRILKATTGCFSGWMYLQKEDFCVCLDACPAFDVEDGASGEWRVSILREALPFVKLYGGGDASALQLLHRTQVGDRYVWTVRHGGLRNAGQLPEGTVLRDEDGTRYWDVRPCVDLDDADRRGVSVMRHRDTTAALYAAPIGASVLQGREEDIDPTRLRVPERQLPALDPSRYRVREITVDGRFLTCRALSFRTNEDVTVRLLLRHAEHFRRLPRDHVLRAGEVVDVAALTQQKGRPATEIVFGVAVHDDLVALNVSYGVEPAHWDRAHFVGSGSYNMVIRLLGTGACTGLLRHCSPGSAAP